MECGDGLGCQLVGWLTQNEYVAATVGRTIAEYGQQLNGVLGQFFDAMKDHFDKVLALAVSSLGFYKWWRYREQILHKRLAEFISEGDRRLLYGQTHVLQALQRPAPGQTFRMPLFADRHLLSVLRERNWDRTPIAANVMSSSELQLSDAMSSIRRKIETAEQHITSLRQQMATAHVLQGAIHSARSARQANQHSSSLSALNAFRSALLIPGREEDVVARELEAHQLRKLKMFPQALNAYEAVEELAATFTHARTRLFHQARCRRYRAEIHQTQYSTTLLDGSRTFQGAGSANSLLSPNVAGSALDILSRLKPLEAWESLEEGDTQYLAAFVAHNLGFVPMRNARLDDAETAYEAVLSRPVRLRERREFRHLRKKAADGLVRVTKAKRDPAEFDVDWLCPP